MKDSSDRAIVISTDYTLYELASLGVAGLPPASPGGVPRLSSPRATAKMLGDAGSAIYYVENLEEGCGAALTLGGDRMGTDSIRLFNKGLADQLLSMDIEHLALFVEGNIEVLKNKRQIGFSSLLYEVKDKGRSVRDAAETLLADCPDFEDLRRDVSLDFAFGNEVIGPDYWGCYAEVFSRGAPDAISSCDYLRNCEEEWFLLLS